MSEPRIKTVSDGDTFEDVISESSPELQQIAHALRELIADVMPGVTEVPWGHQKSAGYGVGKKKMSEHFCYIMPHKDYINLGFFYGADLPDPHGQLEGNGKALRHIKIRTLEQVENPSIRELIEQASVYLPKLK